MVTKGNVCKCNVNKKVKVKFKYDEGFIDGLKAYSYEEEGIMQVGILGDTLDNAIKNRKKSKAYKKGK